MSCGNAFLESGASKGVLTKLKIIHSIDARPSALSIDEICRRCDITRQTFYYHFKSRGDMSTWLTLHIDGFYLDKMGRDYGCLEAYTRHLDLLATEKTFFCHSTKDSLLNRPYRFSIAQTREAIMMDTLTGYCDVEIDDELRYMVSAVTASEVEILCEWFRRGCPQKPREIGRILANCVPARLRALFDESASGGNRGRYLAE